MLWLHVVDCTADKVFHITNSFYDFQLLLQTEELLHDHDLMKAASQRESVGITAVHIADTSIWEQDEKVPFPLFPAIVEWSESLLAGCCQMTRYC